MQNVFESVYSAGTHVNLFFSSFWVLGTCNYLLVRIIYGDFDGEFAWAEDTVTFNMFTNLSQKEQSQSPPFGHWEWERVGFSYNSEKRGQIFRKAMQEVCYSRSVSLTCLFYKHKYARNQWCWGYLDFDPSQGAYSKEQRKKVLDKIGDKDRLCLRRASGWGRLHKAGDIGGGLQGKLMSACALGGRTSQKEDRSIKAWDLIEHATLGNVK